MKINIVIIFHIVCNLKIKWKGMQYERIAMELRLMVEFRDIWTLLALLSGCLYVLLSFRL
jgi:hypothetical protein